MDYHFLVFLLMSLGLGLIVAEVLIPSGGMIGLVAMGCFAGSIWAAWQAWWWEAPGYFWGFLAGLTALIPATMGAAFYVLPKTYFGRKLFPRLPTEDEVVPHYKEEQELRQLIGQTGKTVTMHTPGGMVLLGGKRRHSESEGVLLEKGVPVVVLDIRGNRLLVRETNLAEEAPAASLPEPPSPKNTGLDASLDEKSSPQTTHQEPAGSDLDFDIP